MTKGSFDLKAYARIGAERRLEEIRDEVRAIHAAFPDLRTSGNIVRAARKGGQASLQADTGGVPVKRKRFVMSVEARRAISLAQKRRWRKVRAAKKSSS